MISKDVTLAVCDCGRLLPVGMCANPPDLALIIFLAQKSFFLQEKIGKFERLNLYLSFFKNGL
jgi:hypothetical protein